jgi:hypothetical protein
VIVEYFAFAIVKDLKRYFNDRSVADVSKWDILVELHGEATQRLPALPWPHKVIVIHGRPRIANYPELHGLDDEAKLLSEYRCDGQTWLWCKASVERRRVADQLCQLFTTRRKSGFADAETFSLEISWHYEDPTALLGW